MSDYYPIEAAIKPECDQLRQDLKALEDRVRELSLPVWERGVPGIHSEVYANKMLVIRHIEDARMRIGKMLQYARDGVSIYDKPQP